MIAAVFKERQVRLYHIICPTIDLAKCFHYESSVPSRIYVCRSTYDVIILNDIIIIKMNNKEKA